MVQKPRILLVLVEGLAETVIDSAVLEHASLAREQGIADFNIWAFCWSRQMHRKSRRRLDQARRLAGCEVRLFWGIRPGLPFSTWMNALILRVAMRRLGARPDLIHARDAYSTAVCAFARPRGIPLIWDCRGDWISENAERLSKLRWLPRTIKKFRQRAVQRIQAHAARACDGAIFVSRSLAEESGRGLGDRPSVVIPCAASENLFYFDADLREKTRKGLGYAPHNKVFVYSGSLAPHQCFGELVEEFRAILARDRDARLLVLTPEIEAANRQVAGIDRNYVTILSSTFQEVNHYLNAADAAFMVRRSTPANAVASPVKFAEYSLAGLPVIMTEAVKDAWRQAGELGNRASIEGAGVLLPSSFERQDVARRARLLLGKRRFTYLYDGLVRTILGRRPIPDMEDGEARPIGLR
jgi:glycosyltransferase involved in cell wall biosynthesis